MVGDFVELLREVMTLTSDVRGLKESVDALANKHDDLRERVVRLEAREEVIIEKTHSAAVMAVDRMHNSVLERLVKLEASKAITRALPSEGAEER